jgi:hypothetical protein
VKAQRKASLTCASILAMASLCACSYHINIPVDDLATVSSYENLIDQTISDNRLLVYSFGGPALLVKYRCIRGYGLHALIVNGKEKETVFCCSRGEIDCSMMIDYSDAGSGIFRFTDFTGDPREDQEVPFLLTTVAVLKDGSVRTRETILLKPEEGDKKRISQLRDDALEAAEKESDEVESILGHLRNIGVGDPDNVLEAFASLYGKLGCASSELLSMYEDEVHRVRMLKSQPGRVPEE